MLSLAAHIRRTMVLIFFFTDVIRILVFPNIVFLESRVTVTVVTSAAWIVIQISTTVPGTSARDA